MAVSRSLRRLLRIRNLEEEQSRLALESALGELSRLEQALTATAERDRLGRRLVETSAHSGELQDRLAGLEETRAAVRQAHALTPVIAKAQFNAATLRQAFLAKRIERSQAETLIQEAEVRDGIEAGRRSQQALDDWFLFRLPGNSADHESERPDAAHYAASAEKKGLPET
jgi:hypothetical protein